MRARTPPRRGSFLSSAAHPPLGRHPEELRPRLASTASAISPSRTGRRSDWPAIDQAELGRGEAHDRPRSSFVRADEMLRAWARRTPPRERYVPATSPATRFLLAQHWLQLYTRATRWAYHLDPLTDAGKRGRNTARYVSYRSWSLETIDCCPRFCH